MMRLVQTGFGAFRVETTKGPTGLWTAWTSPVGFDRLPARGASEADALAALGQALRGEAKALRDRADFHTALAAAIEEATRAET